MCFPTLTDVDEIVLKFAKSAKSLIEKLQEDLTRRSFISQIHMQKTKLVTKKTLLYGTHGLVTF
jgi:hypothetical protein